MKDSGVAATSLQSVDKSATSPFKEWAAALAVIFAAALFAFFRGVLFKRLEEGDEGTNATMALNMCGSFEGVLHPSYLAGRAADWLTGSLPAMAVTPFHAGLVALAACPSHGSVAAMGLVSFAALAATVFCTFQLFAIWDRTAGLFAALLCAASPVLLLEFRELEMEPALTAFGIAGLLFLARGVKRERALECTVAGALLGLAFLTKLWLAAPPALAGLSLLLALRAPMRLWVAAAAGFFLAASLHLGFVALFAPHDLITWLQRIYFAPFIKSGIAGSKLTGQGVPPNWIHPWWYYGVVLYRGHFFLMPLLMGGAPSVWAARARLRAPLFTLGGGLLGIVLLSFTPVKEPLYMLSAIPLIYGLAGLSLSSVKREGTTPAALKLAAVASVVSVLGLCLAYAKHIKPEDIDATYVAGQALGLLAVNLVLWASTDARRWVAPLCGSMALLAFAVIDLRAPVQPFAEIAPLLREAVAHRPQQEADFISPNYRVLGLYLFHNGRYWQSYYQTLATDWQEAYSTGRICAFVFGPDDPASKALEPPVAAVATDLTGRLPTWARAYHVYVNPACKTPWSPGIP